MSGTSIAGHLGASQPLSELFRFSSRPNRAHTIHWRTWGEDAFQEAVQQDKPIFLVITSSWCQWCHIMDETTLSEASIITIVNNDYIPIRVDSDMRPDINARYNQNGWPSVVLLSSEGEILWGGVYVPPKQMLYYLGHIRRYYSEHRQEIAEQVQVLQDSRFTRSLTQTLPTMGLRTLLHDERTALTDVPKQAGLVLQDLYDTEYGGFTIHQHLKFPHPEALELLLQLSQHEPSEATTGTKMVSYSLEQMRDGGLWDKEDGGFFRYSAASDWSTPHTEKMLEENASMLHLLLRAAQMTSDVQWYELARQLILYCNSTLWLPEVGVFGGSQRADEEYYEPALYSRATKKPPCVDTTVYTAWNARMVSTYFLAAQVLHYPSLDKMALKTLDWLCEHMLHNNAGVYHYAVHERVALPGQLTDSVWMTRALLDAYERHSIKKYLEAAIALMHFACQELLDEESGLFYDGPCDEHATGRVSVRMQPLTENALAAECLLRMAVYSTRQNLRDIGLLVLSGCLDKYRRTGIQGATYASVVLHAIENQWL
ncbi:MAG: hypothetical protein NVS4B11_08480 [Ktedonobacteraceae bacterium]